MGYINFNGKINNEDQPVLLASNRSYRYGDGLFETIKVVENKIQLSSFHFERLFSSLALLKYTIPSLFKMEKLEREILQLCKKNSCEKLGRVRLSIFRGNGGIYDGEKDLQYLIESWPLNNSVTQFNENGLVIDIFPDAKKNMDQFSNIKSANFLPYSLAAIYAKEHQLNDCLVLNSLGNIADATIANLFIIKDDIISTPGLDQGCINGVMRRYLMEQLNAAGYVFKETAVAIEEVLAADEVFLSNSIYGIRWVKQYKNTVFGNNKTFEIYNRYLKTISA